LAPDDELVVLLLSDELDEPFVDESELVVLLVSDEVDEPLSEDEDDDELPAFEWEDRLSFL
jgi:hypothetical protein